LHHWETLQTSDGEWYDCCARCKADNWKSKGGPPTAGFVGIDYAAFNEVAKRLQGEERPPE
jgi:hypothetical protein